MVEPAKAILCALVATATHPLRVLAIPILLTMGCQGPQMSTEHMSYIGELGKIRVQGRRQYTVSFHPAPGTDRAAIRLEILKFLRSDRGALLADPDSIESDLRQRDIWALVLAKIRGDEMVIYVGESAVSRDAKIEALVRK